jgi:P27 family predicted phage terminase small subunit
MGARGPRPTPTRLKVLRGETRPSRLNRDEPQPAGDELRVPADLGPAATEVWRRVAGAMGATGVLTAADADALRIYAESVARYQHAAGLLDQSGPLITAAGRGARRGELVKNPLHQIVRDNAVLVRAYARELGLTPAARVGLRARDEAEPDPFAAFLDRTAG